MRSQRARRLASLTAVIAFCVIARPALGYEFRLVEYPPLAYSCGEGCKYTDMAYAIVFDTQGESDLLFFSVSVVFDEAAVEVKRAENGDYYPLYTPSSPGVPATWMNESVIYPGWMGAPTDTITFQWVAAGGNPTTATGTDLLVGIFGFDRIGPGSPILDFGFVLPGDGFQVGVDGTDIRDEVGIYVVPEPSVALFLGVGLIGLAVTRRLV